MEKDEATLPRASEGLGKRKAKLPLSCALWSSAAAPTEADSVKRVGKRPGAIRCPHSQQVLARLTICHRKMGGSSRTKTKFWLPGSGLVIL